MKRLLFFLLLPFVLFAQPLSFVVDETQYIHRTPLLIDVTLDTNKNCYVLVELPSTSVNDFGRVMASDSASQADLLSAGLDTTKQIKWAGYCEIDVQLDSVSAAVGTDSFSMQVFKVNKSARVSTNDYTFAKFTTPPGYNSTIVYLDWIDDGTYTTSLSGAFGKGTYALLLKLNANSVVGTAKAKMKIWL